MYMDSLRLSSVGARLICAIDCEIDHHTASSLRTRIDREIFLKRPSVLKLDFRSVRFMDSSGLALIVGRVETMEAVGGRVILTNMGSSLQKLLRLSGIDRLKGLTLEGGVK